MQTVTGTVSETYREKGSKFIGILHPAGSEEAFEQKLEQIRSEYHDATHHCYAYRIGPGAVREIVQDDGEPGGTAGLPILNRLKSYDLVNTGLIVVRYYGGTNLGKSGLIRAYGETAERCLAAAAFEEIIPTETLRVTYPYDRQNEIDRLKASFGLTELDAEYLEEVTLELACPQNNAERLYRELQRVEHLGIRYETLGKDFITG